MTPFEKETADRIAANGTNEELKGSADAFMQASVDAKYSYNFTWLGRPIIQWPQDIVFVQELIFRVQPDLIIETGIAHGGSLVLSASMLELNAACGGPADSAVIGIDVDIRAHNRQAIEAHPLFKRISLLEGSSIAPAIVEQVRKRAAGKRHVLVFLDSNHSHEHVLGELEVYAPLVSVGSYCVVFDTIVEHLRTRTVPGRPWGVGNNPKTAVLEYVKSHPEFEIDSAADNKLLISAAPSGYLKRTR
jgi:cephalosporin hydroxylase